MRVFLVCMGVGVLLNAPGYAQISFDIPDSHPKYALLDSMYRATDTLDRTMKAIETALLRDKKTRTAALSAKSVYLDARLAAKKVDTAAVRSYYQAALAYYESLEAYFNELCPAIEGNDRAPCFSILKGARQSKNTVTRLMSRYERAPTPMIRPTRMKLDLGE